MSKGDDRELIINMKLPGTCSADLRGRQSVRATFKLSSACIDAISVVSKHLGIKQKSLFDHLAEDIQSLSSIAREIHLTSLPREHRIQKTYVISRRSLCALEQVSKSYDAPRDALVEFSVQRLLPLIANERRNQEKRKEMFGVVKKHFQEGSRLLAKWHKALGDEDPLFGKYRSAIHAYADAIEEMQDIIEQGKIIEMFDPEIFEQLLNDALE